MWRKTGAFGKLSKWSGEKLEKYYNSIEEKKYDDLESAADLIYRISTYMLENKFVNMIKEELIQKEIQIDRRREKESSFRKDIKGIKIKNITVPNKSTLYIQCVKYYSKLGIYRASAKNIRYYTQFFRSN